MLSKGCGGARSIEDGSRFVSISTCIAVRGFFEEGSKPVGLSHSFDRLEDGVISVSGIVPVETSFRLVG